MGNGSQFPPGFRFHPTDQELIIHYLEKKVTASVTPATSIIADIDLYKFNPWELPGKAFFGEDEWFFFSPRDRKYPKGARPNRAAASGYWKATGTDKPILASGGSQCLGVKKALVFYKGRPLKGIKTDWVMHEYRIPDAISSSSPQKPKDSMRLDDWVLCRVHQKGANLPTESEEKQDSSAGMPCLPASSNVHNTDQEQPALWERDGNNFYEWSDYQLLAYLLDSQEEQGDKEYGNLDLSSSESTGLDNIGFNGFSIDHQMQPPQMVSSMLNSIKRTLSFGAMDELMLLPPSKRMHFSSTLLEHEQS